MSYYCVTIEERRGGQASPRAGSDENSGQDPRVCARLVLVPSGGIKVAPMKDRREAGILLACATDDRLGLQIHVDFDDLAVPDADRVHYRCTGIGDAEIRERVGRQRLERIAPLDFHGSGLSYHRETRRVGRFFEITSGGKRLAAGSLSEATLQSAFTLAQLLRSFFEQLRKELCENTSEG